MKGEWGNGWDRMSRLLSTLDWGKGVEEVKSKWAGGSFERETVNEGRRGR